MNDEKTLKTSMAAVSGLLLMILGACGGGAGESDDGDGDGSAPPAEQESFSLEAEMKAEQIYKGRCVTCHGESGHGDGPGATALTAKPASFATADWQQSVTDEHIEQIIKFGGAAVGKSPSMPGNPDLKSQGEVVKALRAYVRGLGKR